jgi:hypothetical protein
LWIGIILKQHPGIPKMDVKDGYRYQNSDQADGNETGNDQQDGEDNTGEGFQCGE